jgi:hypothetical protein
VSIATALAGLALPLLVGHVLLVRSVQPSRDDHARRGAYVGLLAILAAGVALTASAVLFQAAAARNLSPLLGAAPSALLLAFALRRYRASS